MKTKTNEKCLQEFEAVKIVLTQMNVIRGGGIVEEDALGI